MTDSLFDLSDYTEEREPTERGFSASCAAGEIAELCFFAEAAKRGLMIYTPLGHSTNADCILWNRHTNKPITVQIKKGVLQKCESWKIVIGAGRPSCAQAPSNNELRYRRYTEGDFDIIAMYVKERDSFVMWHLRDVCSQSSIRWSPSNRNGIENNWDIFNE